MSSGPASCKSGETGTLMDAKSSETSAVSSRLFLVKSKSKVDPSAISCVEGTSWRVMSCGSIDSQLASDSSRPLVDVSGTWIGGSPSASSTSKSIVPFCSDPWLSTPPSSLLTWRKGTAVGGRVGCAVRVLRTVVEVEVAVLVLVTTWAQLERPM